MMQNPVLVMSLSGTVAFMLYLLLYPVTKKYCSPQMRYQLLKISMIFYLVPFPYYKYKIIEQINKAFPDLQILRVDQAVLYLDNIVLHNEQTVIYSLFAKTTYVIAVCSGIFSAIMLTRSLCRYVRAKKLYMSHSKEISPSCFKKEVTELGIKRRITFVVSKYFTTPFTIGMINPVIVIPDIAEGPDAWSKPSNTYMIKHELAHIKNGDSLTKILSLAVIALHWYNPVCYILYHEIKVMCEICCDTEVVSRLSRKEQKSYFMFLIQLSSERQTDTKGDFLISFKNHTYQLTKRRIQEMNYLNRKKKKALMVFAATMVCSLSTITTFAAYQPPIEIRGRETGRLDRMDFVVVEQEGVGSFEMGREYLPYDCFIRDEDGNIFEYDEKTQEKANCGHQVYNPVTLNAHSPEGDGGCTVIVFEAEQCAACGKIVIKQTIKEVTYTKCPH